MRTYTQSFFTVCCIIATITIGGTLFAADAPSAQPVIHLLLAVDSSVNPCGLADADTLARTFANNVPEKQLQVESVALDSPNTLLKKVSDILTAQRVSEQDTVVFYYNGTGGKNPQDGNPIYIFPNNTILQKQTIFDAIKKFKPRLSVVISECRSAKEPGQPVAADGQKPLFPAAASLLFQQLFFDTAGTIDIAAAQRGEEAFGFTFRTHGSIFTHTFCDTLNQCAGVKGKMTWENFFRLVKRATQNQCVNDINAAVASGVTDNRKPFTPQMVKIAETIIFGAKAQITPDGNGVKVVAIKTDSVAEQNGLEIGDIILSIDDKPIRRIKDYTDAIDNAGVSIVVVIRNVRNGQIERYKFRLRYDVIFGAKAAAREDGHGVTIIDIVPGYPAMKCGLEIGDVILEIDGKLIRNEADYVNAIDLSGDAMELQVRNHRNGQIIPIVVPMEERREPVP